MTDSIAVTRPPGLRRQVDLAVGADHAVDGQAVGGDDQIELSGWACSHLINSCVGDALPPYGDPDGLGRAAIPSGRTHPAHYLQSTMRISDVIRRKGDLVVTVRSDDTVRHLLAVLDEHRIGAVVVSDDDGATVAGIVSERDVVRHLHSRRRPRSWTTSSPRS